MPISGPSPAPSLGLPLPPPPSPPPLVDPTGEIIRENLQGNTDLTAAEIADIAAVQARNVAPTFPDPKVVAADVAALRALAATRPEIAAILRLLGH